MSETQMPASLTLIKDPALEPYFIGKDSNSYTVYETVYPGTNENGRGRKTREKEAVKTLSFHSSIASALNSIAKLKVENRPVYNTIKEYIVEWNRVKEEINQIVNF
jgi:hypothetical protein